MVILVHMLVRFNLRPEFQRASLTAHHPRPMPKRIHVLIGFTLCLELCGAGQTRHRRWKNVICFSLHEKPLFTRLAGEREKPVVKRIHMIAGRLLGLKRLVARLTFEFRRPMVQHRHVLIRRRLSSKFAVASLAMESIIAIRASVVFAVRNVESMPD
jgi:hypothetical protein